MLAYLGTPFSKAQDLHAAYRSACEQAAFLMREGIDVFSPIAHSYGIAEHGGLEHLDHEWWMARCQAFMHRCDAMILCRLPGWQDSEGMEMERDWFLAAARPVIHMEPWEVPERLIPHNGGWAYAAP